MNWRSVSRWPGGVDWSYELLVLLLLVAETAALYLLSLLVGASAVMATALPGPVVIFVLILAGSATQRAVDAARLLSPHYEIVTGSALFVVLAWAIWAISLPSYRPWNAHWVVEAGRALALFPARTEFPVWGTVGMVAYGWWRGKQRDEPGLEAAHRLLRAGAATTLVSLVALVIVGPPAADAVWRSAFLTTVTFFSAALAATALARLRLEEGRGALRLTPRWLLAVLWPVLLLVTFSALVSGLFTRSLLETLLWLLTPLFAVGRLVLLLLLYIVTFFAYIAIMVFTWFLAQLGPLGVTPPASRPMALATPALEPTTGIRYVPYANQLRVLVAFAAVAGIVWLLTRFFWRRRPRPLAGANETRASVFSWRLLGNEVAALAQRIARRYRPRLDALDTLRRDARWRYTVAVRETYREFLRHGRDLSVAMMPDETPTSYAARRSAQATSASAAHHELAKTYNAVRYGSLPATASDAANARAAWREVARQAPSERRRLTRARRAPGRR